MNLGQFSRKETWRVNRVFVRDFTLGVVQRIEGGESISALSRELGIKREILYR